MADNKRHWDNERGRGWQRILEGPDKGQWEYYDNWAPTGKIDRSGAKDAIPNLIKGAQNTLSWIAEDRNKKQREESRKGKKRIQTGRGSRWVDDPDAGNVETSPTPIPTQNDIATQTVPDTGGDEKDDTSSGVIEQPPKGDDQEQANTENRGELKKNIDRQIAVAKNEEYLKSVSWDGMNRTYTSNYREAVKNAAGWSAYYDDSPDPNNPIKKSDVFTRGEDGLPLGVMTRSQRRAYDERMHEAKMNRQKQKYADEATGGSGIYGEKGKEITTEWTTDQEANEEGKVITGGESAKADVGKGSQPKVVDKVKTISENKKFLGS